MEENNKFTTRLRPGPTCGGQALNAECRGFFGFSLLLVASQDIILQNNQ